MFETEETYKTCSSYAQIFHGPWVYSNFAEHGYHTARRSDKYWAVLWSDLIIEQCLMRSLQSRVTRGS